MIPTNIKNYVWLQEGASRDYILRCLDCGEESRLPHEMLIRLERLSSLEASHECKRLLQAETNVGEGKV